METRFAHETISKTLKIAVSREHKFGTDAFLLSHFTAPRRRDTAADFCSGSGIVALLWQRRAETTPRMSTCIELQEAAVAQLEETIALNCLHAHMQVCQLDLKNLPAIKALGAGRYDVISCNPPYKAVGTGILSGGASDKIARHETACTTGDIAAAAATLLRFGGRLCICQRPERLADILCAFRAHKLEVKRIRFVQQRADTQPWLVLIEAKKGAKPFLQVEPPLIVEGAGGFSAEMLKIYGKLD